MTTYRGTVTITMNGVLDGYGPFTAYAPVTTDLWNASLAPDGMLSATLAGSGPLYVTAAGNTGMDWLVFPSTPFTTPIAAPQMPFDEAVPGLTLTWTETNSFNAERTVVTTAGSGVFSGVLEGVGVSGTMTASGALAATSAAYSIAVATVPAVEGNTGTAAYTFTVTRLGASDGFGSIAWQVSGFGPDPAIATDFAGFTMPMGVLAFAAGETQKTLSVSVLGDDLPEGNEGFAVTLANAPGEVIAVTSMAQGVILNDDVVRLSVDALAADVAEGPEGGSTAASFTISRAGSTALGASVHWAVQGIGATPADAQDFAGGALPSGTVAFLPGEASQAIAVPVLGDAAAEAQESFAVVLSNPSGAMLERGSAPGLILNDDGGAAQVAAGTPASETFAMGDGSDLVRYPAERASYRVGMAGNHVMVQGPDGNDEIVDAEWLKFGTAPALTLEAWRARPDTDELIGILATGPGGMQLRYAMPLAYDGPGDLAYVHGGTNGDDIVSGTTRNDFMNLGGGNDAAHMGAGNDILDGGGGSNFLTGGEGRDSFFLDGRFADPVWSCIADWEPGESLALWGWRAGVSVGIWAENAGLPGYLGATFFADIDGSGAVETAVTWTGRTVAELPGSQALEVGGIGVLVFV